MTIRDKIDLDYKNSLKSKDKIKISTYRLILSGIKDLDISNRSGPKKIETQEQKILSTYLPKQLSEEETKKICTEIIAATNASSIKDMGRVMGELKKKYSDTVDFSLAGKVLKDLLNK